MVREQKRHRTGTTEERHDLVDRINVCGGRGGGNLYVPTRKALMQHACSAFFGALSTGFREKGGKYGVEACVRRREDKRQRVGVRLTVERTVRAQSQSA